MLSENFPDLLVLVQAGDVLKVVVVVVVVLPDCLGHQLPADAEMDARVEGSPYSIYVQYRKTCRSFFFFESAPVHFSRSSQPSAHYVFEQYFSAKKKSAKKSPGTGPLFLALF